ncbi:MAG: GFA family protein [Pseudomonadales bacterium]
MRYAGGCHCGAVRIEVEADARPVCHECNCSMCRKTGFIHLIVPRSALRLVSGEDALATYTFNTGVAQHYFCRHCGVRPFYVPRSNPDGYSVNVRCLDEMPAHFELEPFDGANWEASGAALAHLSRES